MRPDTIGGLILPGEEKNDLLTLLGNPQTVFPLKCREIAVRGKVQKFFRFKITQPGFKDTKFLLTTLICDFPQVFRLYDDDTTFDILLKRWPRLCEANGRPEIEQKEWGQESHCDFHFLAERSSAGTAGAGVSVETGWWVEVAESMTDRAAPAVFQPRLVRLRLWIRVAHGCEESETTRSRKSCHC